MLYVTLSKIKEKNNGVLPEDVKRKVDVFYALGRLNDVEYRDLMGITIEDVSSEENKYIAE